MGKLVRRGPAHRGKRPRRKSATAFFGEGLAKRDPRNSAQDRRGKARQGRDRRGEARRGQERQGKASKAAVKCCQQRGLGAQPFQLTRCPLAESQCMAPKTHLRPPCWRAPPPQKIWPAGVRGRRPRETVANFCTPVPTPCEISGQGAQNALATPMLARAPPKKFDQRGCGGAAPAKRWRTSAFQKPPLARLQPTSRIRA